MIKDMRGEKLKGIIVFLSLLMVAIFAFTSAFTYSRSLKEDIGRSNLNSLILLETEIELLFEEYDRVDEDKIFATGETIKLEEQEKMYPIEYDADGNVILPSGGLEEFMNHKKAFSNSQQKIELIDRYISESSLLSFMSPSIENIYKVNIDSVGTSDYENIKKVRDEIGKIINEVSERPGKSIGYNTYKYLKDKKNINRIKESISLVE